MGLFSGSKKTYVSSVVYNMAGPEEERVSYLKTTVIGAVLSQKSSIATTIVNSYLNGPGIKLKRFGRWARTSEYTDEVGLVTGSIFSSSSVDIAVLTGYLPTEPDSTIEVQRVDIGPADYSYWGDRHVAENFPELLYTDYVTDYDSTVNLITITFEDTTTDSFTPVNYSAVGRYIYASYVYKYTAPATPAETYSTAKVFIYKYGDGNTVLDAMFSGSENSGQFFPAIPMRLDNKFISEEYPDTLYPLAKKAIKKAINGKFDDLEESIKDNESIDDIDYAYIVFGTSLNTRENTAKEYIYQFFSRIFNEPNQTGAGSYSSWQAEWNTANTSWLEWKAWQEGGSVGVEPVKIPYPPMPSNTIKITSSLTSKMNYNVSISWNYIEYSFGTGLFREDVKKGDVDIVLGSSDAYEPLEWVKLADGTWTVTAGGITESDTVTIFKQESDTAWVAYTIQGLKYSNLIYNGKSVEISAKEALEDAEESGFIIPLHEEIYDEMPLIKATQMASACSYMVFNCYQVVKQKWYQTGIFKVIVFVIAIAVTVYSGGTGAGLLGSAVSVGAALGFTGVIAIVVGAVANALAAMILMSILQDQASNLFGDKLGALIAAIATFVAVTYGQSLNAGSATTSFGDMMSAQNIMGLMDAAGKGYAGYMQASVNETVAKTNALQEQYNKESLAIKNKYMEEFGMNLGEIDALLLTDTFGSLNESFNSFIGRTLMVGSDVAALSLDLIGQFCDVTLMTELQTV